MRACSVVSDSLRPQRKGLSLLIELVDVYGGGGLVAKSYLTLMTPWTVACQAPLSMEFSR